MDNTIRHDIENDIITLGFAARLLLTNLETEVIIERACETVADFGLCSRIGLFLFNPKGDLICVGGFVNKQYEKRSYIVILENTPWETVLDKKDGDYFALDYEEDIPLPVNQEGIPGRKCLCSPLVAANDRIIGLITFDYDADFHLPPLMMQSLLLLLTIVAVALETARLFQQAVFDGLTGLYIRRYFDLRLLEEENRIKRYSGKLAILMIDIDHFKSINDQYGHQQGDVVLQDIADIVRNSVRKELDSPCRYGGEEFVVIMPDTDLGGALIVAERIRHSVQSHLFERQEGPFHVTLSGGIAFMDHSTFTPGSELLKRADNALYLAKANGRNQIQVWED